MRWYQCVVEGKNKDWLYIELRAKSKQQARQMLRRMLSDDCVIHDAGLHRI